jgi:hypothetical protein
MSTLTILPKFYTVSEEFNQIQHISKTPYKKLRGKKTLNRMIQFLDQQCYELTAHLIMSKIFTIENAETLENINEKFQIQITPTLIKFIIEEEMNDAN